MKCENVSRLSH